MSKMKLNLDTLAVQSFETAGAGAAARGTVDGHAIAKTYNGCTSEIDACPSARGCTFLENCETQNCVTYDAACKTYNGCTSEVDACPTGRGCSDVFVC
ncbi:hypothetical protein [Longimicrobium terrae]|uniref:Uncharacterized protein n=1 Tax=Longimicrobium terrae TaxID=1639882 RepID=A0A841GWF5_9BACT|nr:hypothetical protein [Longimicrobium terrae]MBB4635740.1 hypothetical protein [Longimicrobium terrae]MBB6070134.1 hypothetical protein [Longimicrobium terrae]NNC33035.1 hypothetical protein [Longimicrobium terrae]